MMNSHKTSLCLVMFQKGEIENPEEPIFVFVNEPQFLSQMET